MGANKDIEEKFKKDVSKEIANLKEFLIQQGKEIVKIKQDTKIARELHGKGDGTPVGTSPDIKALLEKQQHALDKQKENTTKLSKLCLGTLTELEKLEKQQQEKQTDDKIRRLTDENKKLIHLVTALDQQVTVLEGRVERGGSRPPSRQDHPHGAGLGRDEVLRIVRDNMEPGGATREDVAVMIREQLANLQQENVHRDGQIESLITEMQNVIGQNREGSTQIKELNEKVRRLERDEFKEKAGLELATAISRIEKLELTGTRPAAADKQAVKPDPRVDRIDEEVRTLKSTVAENSVRLDEKLGNEIRGVASKVQDTKKYADDIGRGLEEKIVELDSSVKIISGKVERCMQTATSSKAAADEATKQLERLRKEEESARMERSEKSAVSSEEMTRDLHKLHTQTQFLEEKILSTEKTTESLKIDVKNTEKKLTTELAMVSEKVKTLSVSSKDDRLRTEDRLSRLEKDVTSARDTEDRVKELATSVSSVQKTLQSVEDSSKKIKTDLEVVKSDVKSTNASNGKCLKSVEDLNMKIFDCIHDTDALKDTIEKVSKKVDRRPPPEEADKKSELTNKLYNDLASKIEDLDGDVKKEVKKTKAELDKINMQVKSMETKLDERINTSNKEVTAAIDTSKSTSDRGIKEVKDEADKLKKEVKSLVGKLEETKQEAKSAKTETNSLRSSLDRLKGLEGELAGLKKDNTSTDKMNQLEKELSSLRTDLEKGLKDVKLVSTELKYLDSNIKKDAASGKTEIQALSKTVKGVEKDYTTLHNMVEVLNQQNGESAVSEEVAGLRSDLKKVASDLKACDKKVDDVEKRLTTKIDKNSGDIEGKVNEIKTTFTKTISTEAEAKSKKVKDELNVKIEACLKSVKSVEDKVETSSKSKPAAPDTKDVDARIETAKGQLKSAIDTAVQKCKDDITTKVTLCDTKVQKLREDTNLANKEANSKIKELEGKVGVLEKEGRKVPELDGRLKKVEDTTNKLTKQIESVEASSKQGPKTDNKEVDKLNKEIKESLSKWEGKMTAQETQVSQVKQSVKDIADKIGKLEKPSSKPDETKKEVDAVNKLVRENIKKVDDKLSAQEKGMKEISEKIGKLGDASKPMSQDTSKLVALTKAIDTIQENSKSLETMVKKMKTEVPTQKDLEKIRSEIMNKVGGGGGKELDVDHPDIGPLMDSLIMTNDRPYVDCTTLTPMTGNGLIKFERFNAMNKMPWDDANDQFIIQEPGVYAVCVSAILQDAVLSIKIASNMLEREVCTVGSREGLVGVQAPAFVSRNSLFQIEDDDNVCETILVEIHADNEDSFIDKNVCFSLFKIAESPGGD